MASVMMKTTMKDVNGMEGTVVVLMSLQLTVLFVNVWILMEVVHLHHQEIHVDLRGGKVITSVMMKTTMLDVNGMEGTVVVLMSIQLTVLFANVWILMEVFSMLA